ncbi:hypothetical protein GF1_26670 [Desulfolithobacter dissulfuricans]|uniref:Redoxin domain-containing protein n=1 Tax=Desulfolithobacter dissulfuricans TaxID=2795293 RepID=A0A915U2S6_9BACT|nr:tetratricopeptide repeat protein [Desulfolithobacter dissulfuricans]BCO10291.1 hypothetical protein GF1_26670 [Desulfolithobacter dissulfuricans]
MVRTISTYRRINFFLLSLFIAGFFVINGTGRAESFPFRSLKIGKPAPDVEFAGFRTEPGTSIHAHAGKPILLVFWGGDLEAKKKRSIKVLKVVKDLQPYLKEKGVTLLVVNVQNDGDGVVNEVMEKTGLSVPLYVDPNRTAYGKFGLYVLPSVLLIDAKGNVAGGVGYSKDIAERLRGEVDVMLGEKTREQLEAELNPEMKEMPKEQKLARRHMHMGMTMKHKGMLEAAVREMKKALELDPQLTEARVELGCLYVDQDKLDEAIKELEAGLDQEPDSLKAEICLARVSMKMGELEEALADMQALLFRHGRDPDLHFLIGTLQEKLGAPEEAAREYKKAYELLQRKMMLHE